MKIVINIARFIAAIILLQTLYFKFTAAPESVYIFSKLGMEPVGRIATGIAELIAALLLLFPATASIGALIAVGLMSGAIFFHLSILGIEVMGDDGLLFIYGLLVMMCSILVLVFHPGKIFDKLPFLTAYFNNEK